MVRRRPHDRNKLDDIPLKKNTRLQQRCSLLMAGHDGGTPCHSSLQCYFAIILRGIDRSIIIDSKGRLWTLCLQVFVV